MGLVTRMPEALISQLEGWNLGPHFLNLQGGDGVNHQGAVIY